MTSLGQRLIQSATEARAIARGEADPSTYRVHVPSDVDVATIRRNLRMTQAEFGSAFGFPAGTVRDWEQGRRRPDTAARAYLMVIGRNPAAVQEALAAEDVTGASRAASRATPKVAKPNPGLASRAWTVAAK